MAGPVPGPGQRSASCSFGLEKLTVQRGPGDGQGQVEAQWWQTEVQGAVGALVLEREHGDEGRGGFLQEGMSGLG